MTEHANPTIHHNPNGNGHPYNAGPTGRYPAFPVAGEALTLFARASLHASSLRAEWRIGHETKIRVASGVLLNRDEEGSDWEIALPALPGGRQVTYRICADDNARESETPWFSFDVADWCEIQEAQAITVHGNRIQITGRLECPGCADIAIELMAPSTISMQVQLIPESTILEPGDDHSVDAKLDDPLRWTIDDISTQDCFAANSNIARIEVQRNPFRITISTSDGTHLLEECDSPAWLVVHDGTAKRFRQTFRQQKLEGFFGFGERFNSLAQQGNTLDVRVYEQYKDQGNRTYMPLPFFLSRVGYGHYINSARHIAYDLGADSAASVWQYSADVPSDGSLETHLFVGAPKTVIAGFHDAIGAPPKCPPSWTFGPWMSGNEWNTQERVMAEARRSIELDIPVSVVVIEAWSDETTFYLWNDAQYAPKASEEAFSYDDLSFPADGHWPDPKQMIDELHGLGIRVVLWQIPVLKHVEEPHPQQETDRSHMVEKGYCVLEESGDPYRVRPPWFHDGLVLDVTNPDAIQWWLNKRAYLLDELEIDGFKTDGGEHLWGTELRFHDGRRGDELWNLYPDLYVGAYHEFACEHRGGDATTFSRAGFSKARSFPCHWAGDEDSTWAAYRASLTAGLTAGLSGIIFWGWDLAGFSGEIPSDELFMRATAMSAFCPIMQYHSEYNDHRQPCRDRTPWNIAERTDNPRVVEIYRKFAELRMKLIPYIEEEAQHCVKIGEPLMRPLLLDWPDDPVCWQIDDQYCFGRDMLIAPILEPGVSTRRLYLPRGEWLEYWTGESHTGARWITVSAELDQIPVFVKANGHNGKDDVSG